MNHLKGTLSQKIKRFVAYFTMTCLFPMTIRLDVNFPIHSSNT